MLFTGLGRSVLGETVHSAWVPPSAYGLRRYSRPRAQFLPIRTSQPVNNIYIFQQVLCILLQVLIVRFYLNTNASVNSTCAQPPPPGISIFFASDGKFPGVGTLELSNSPGWSRKKRANAPSSVNTATFFIDRTALVAATTCTSLWFYYYYKIIDIKINRAL